MYHNFISRIIPQYEVLLLAKSLKILIEGKKVEVMFEFLKPGLSWKIATVTTGQ